MDTLETLRVQEAEALEVVRGLDRVTDREAYWSARGHLSQIRHLLWQVQKEEWARQISETVCISCGRDVGVTGHMYTISAGYICSTCAVDAADQWFKAHTAEQ